VRRARARTAGLAATLVLGLTLAGCGSTQAGLTGSQTVSIPQSLLRSMRPIGAGQRFHPLVTGSPTGGCQAAPGVDKVHIELFAANRVVLIAAGVGHRGHCYGNVVTTDPTGILHYRRGATLEDLFQAWGEPLSATKLASFSGRVRYYVAGRQVKQVPALAPHAEIVLEVGPYVPPHRTFTFPAGL
jgi:hypothetical protein